MKMTGVLFVGGKTPDFEFIKEYITTADTVVAADSGYGYAKKHSVTLDFVVGDMDSVEEIDEIKRFPPSKKKIVSHEKDDTDTELGLKYLWENGVEKIIIIGGGGGRLDHLIGLLTLFERSPHPYQWITDNSRIVSIDNNVTMETEIGELISFFPVGSGPCRMESRGLKWPLNGLTWKKGDMGISNEASARKIEITMKQGRLIMVKSLTKERIIE